MKILLNTKLKRAGWLDNEVVIKRGDTLLCLLAPGLSPKADLDMLESCACMPTGADMSAASCQTGLQLQSSASRQAAEPGGGLIEWLGTSMRACTVGICL
jgi:hypothetical protein